MINHRVCDHEATPAARRACRKAYQAEQLKLQTEEPARLTAAQEILAAVPYAKRAIVITFTLKDGHTCKVVYDRHGMNSQLFREAVASGWGADRTIAQACSNAIHSVMGQYGASSIETYRVHEVA